MLKGKVGFVIPKNKFSGSLVPIFKKSHNNDAAPATAQEINTPHHRKTRWASDLTQDATVKRGRALAYQTRVDQIAQQLKLGPTRNDDQNSNFDGDAPNNDLAPRQAKLENFQSLELEKREAIGEILKLNPGYKIPSDYEPVLREATVPIPVKAHPEYNFLGLVYGSDGETQKRLEKETGTRIQVYGVLTETRKEVEITSSDESDVLRVCEEAYVRISADTYEKVDAAADLIELLLNSVLIKPADSKETISVSGDGQDMATTTSTCMASQEIIQPVTGPISFPQYPNPWFPAGQSGPPSGANAVPSSGPLSFQRPSFGPGPPAPYFGSSLQSTTIIPPRLHSPALILQGMISAYRVGLNGPPRNVSAPTSASASPFAAHQSNILLSERPLIPTQNSPGWPSPAPPSALSTSPSQYPSPQGRPSATSYAPPQIRAQSGVPFQSFSPQVQLNSSRSPQFPVPRPSPSPGMPRPSFTSLNSVGPPLQGSSDFTFKPHPLQGQSVQFTSQRPSQAQFPPVPQMPSFRPALQSSNQQLVRQSFPGPPVGNQMGPSPTQFGAPNLNPQMGLRNHGPVSRFPNGVGSLPPRAGPTSQFQPSQNRPAGIFGGNQHSGRHQVYDPFRPTSLPATQAQVIGRKQESDPEYEDLMASVGVK